MLDELFVMLVGVCLLLIQVFLGSLADQCPFVLRATTLLPIPWPGLSSSWKPIR